ncbi:Protein Y38C1AA.9, partial [Aphelenchoides avenae]
ACTAAQCNERGTCFGSKAMPICLCQLGHAGPKCEDSYCDSARDCGGRGWCMGTSTQFTCLCNIGYTGDRCQLEASAPGASGSAIIPTMAPIVAPPSPAVGSGSVPIPSQQPFPGQGQQ